MRRTGRGGEGRGGGLKRAEANRSAPNKTAKRFLLGLFCTFFFALKHDTLIMKVVCAYLLVRTDLPRRRRCPGATCGASRGANRPHGAQTPHAGVILPAEGCAWWRNRRRVCRGVEGLCARGLPFYPGRRPERPKTQHGSPRREPCGRHGAVATGGLAYTF